jgi:hypothetical protein
MDQLNLPLTKFRLRLGLAGYPLVVAQEDLCHALIKALVCVVRKRPWLKRWWDPGVLATAVTGYLFEKCLAGKTARFTWKYLLDSLKGFLKTWETPPARTVDLPPAVPQAEDDWDLEVGALAQGARKIAAELRTGLDSHDRELFDTWEANGNGQGWRSRFAERQGVSPAWVVRHMTDLRARLGRKLCEEAFALVDPDQFMEFLHWLETSPKEEPEETAAARAEIVLDYATQKVRLEAVFAGQPEILDLMAAYGEGQPEEYILANLPGLLPDADPDARCRVHTERLRQVHQAYVGLAQAFWNEVKARRYYERLQARKANVTKVVRAQPPWPEEKIALAHRLQELARQRVSFEDLPAPLGLSVEEVVALLLDIRRCK